MARILLVEDDPALREGLTELFMREGYAVEAVEKAAKARAAMGPRVDLAVLDVSLPDGDGVALCREWREAGVETPVLFLTARDEEFDIVRGLDSGGNDYVTKPFRLQELLSRIRALLRRGSAPQPLRSGAVQIDQERMVVRRDGETVPLTLMEYKILVSLMQAGGVVTRNRLLEALWDVDSRFVDDNTLSVHVSRLREKIGAEHVKTIRGVGYQWVD